MADASAGGFVRVETANAVCRVRLSRPERLNALGEEIRRELHDVVRNLAEESLARIVLLEGEGRAFSAGADLKDREPLPDDWAARRTAAGRWQRLLDDLEALPQVTVAALHGHVVGGAFLLAAACDLRIASSETTFFIPEVAMGIPLTWAGLPRLVREIGLPRTRELVMTGRRVGADEAHAWGFVQRLSEPDKLEEATARLLDELLRMPSGPLAMTRAALAALGRRDLPLGWADPDLLAWALRDPEVASSFAAYRSEKLGD